MSNVAPDVTPRDNGRLVYPLHGKQARQVQLSTGRQGWTWDTWSQWMERVASRKDWRKTPIRKMMDLRCAEARSRGDNDKLL